jgi:aspartate/methionine/tyrosine aminotransferase
MQLANQLEKLGSETAFSVSLAAADWAARGNIVYPFHLGDLNIPTPEKIVEEAFKAIRDGYTGYCPGAGIEPLRDVLASDVGNKRGISYSAENVSIQPGGKPVIGKFLMAVMNPGDEVLYPNPGFPIYESQIEYHGGKAIPYGYIENKGKFELDMDTLKNSINNNTRALIYNNYQNPNGAESSRDEMEALAELAQSHDLWVLSDDAYYEIQYEKEPLSIVNIPGMQDRTVILYTCSKRYAMTGWRLGAAIGPSSIIKYINTMNSNAESCTPHFIQRAMIDVIGGDDSAAKSILAELKRRRDATNKGLNAIDGIDITAPASTFYLFPNVNQIMQRKGISEIGELMTQALENTGVSFCTRNHFGRPVKGEENHYVRFAYSGIAVDDINNGLAKLKTWFESS